MAKSQQTFGKKEKEKKRREKREEKAKKKEARKENTKSGNLEDMIMYVDADGNFTDTPPDPALKKKIKAENIEISVPKGDRVAHVDPVKYGIVDFFDHSKGFGFIKETDTRDKFFVHINGCTEEITEGNKVSFELEQGMKGMNCVNVKKEA